MIKKDAQFKWKYVEKEAFEKVKPAISAAPTLQSPNFSREILLNNFTSNHSLAVVLT